MGHKTAAHQAANRHSPIHLYSCVYEHWHTNAVTRQCKMHHFTSSLFWPQVLPSLRGVSDVIPLAFPFKEIQLDIDIEIKNESSDRYERERQEGRYAETETCTYTRGYRKKERQRDIGPSPKEVHGCVGERFFMCAKLCYGM